MNTLNLLKISLLIIKYKKFVKMISFYTNIFEVQQNDENRYSLFKYLILSKYELKISIKKTALVYS